MLSLKTSANNSFEFISKGLLIGKLWVKEAHTAFFCLIRINPVWHACVILLCLWGTDAVSSARPWRLVSVFTYHWAFSIPIRDMLLLFGDPCFSVFVWVCVCVTLRTTWLISLVHAAFSCRDGASNTTVNEGESDGSTTSLKSSWPNTWPPDLAVW